MDALDKLKNRKSCRSFLEKPIPDEDLDEILDIGLAAASGGNTQPITIIKVRNNETKKTLRQILGQNFIEAADTILFFILDFYKQRKWCQLSKSPYGRHRSFLEFIISLEDVMCTAQSIESACTLKDIGCVYLGTPNLRYEELKEILSLPELTIPVLAMCLGYPKNSGKPNKKLNKNAVIFEEKYKILSDEEIIKYYDNEKYNNIKININDKNFNLAEKLFEISKQVESDSFANEVKNYIKEKGYINAAQKLFGLHYNPIEMIGMNEWIWNFFKSQGFDFLDNSFHINRLDVK
ncbi:FMN reductase [NAD(P)H] [Thermoanaerobacter uzonensis DSM 18761]|jgi:FMN reductase [NAD(P)H]|uniref:FMN reductase [NAD(P)H] n=1 Tax=Thermoanaerobacter uzonensis DSM 18761 TaxID=1123369 RepID=A0A1M4WGV7_9THEO|nr:nitroreductase family protein [Thermoanaerobacter uzonensis]SHE80390.1 FMN reductase [NAD(P)H] [Thermoanaerobacter uzonensis DSM 18761]